MSATVETIFLYEANCPICRTASEQYESEYDALEWAAHHDAVLHAEDDGSDDDYEKFKESRK